MDEGKNKQLVGVKEIARRANVSIATVDRVLHQRTGVSKSTRDKILAIIEELEYTPNVFARRLSTSKVIRVALLIPHSSAESAFWDAPLAGIKKAAAQVHQYGIEVDECFFDQNKVDSFDNQASIVLQGDYDAVIVAPMFTEKVPVFLESLDKKKIPYVLINSDVPERKGRCYFGPDLFQSGYMGGHLLRYLMPTGKLLLVNISKEIDNRHHLRKKEEGIRSYLQQNVPGIDLRNIDIRDTDYEQIKNALDIVWKDSGGFDAVFVTNSRVASVARYMAANGLADIILIGYDFTAENVQFLEENLIDFLICQKPFEQGYRAMMALYNKLIFDTELTSVNYMPIDIVTKENYKYYEN